MPLLLYLAWTDKAASENLHTVLKYASDSREYTMLRIMVCVAALVVAGCISQVEVFDGRCVHKGVRLGPQGEVKPIREWEPSNNKIKIPASGYNQYLERKECRG